ncbi:MAG: hypothetical protein V2B20_24100 [Pseudomonadota bacterium]
MKINQIVFRVRSTTLSVFTYVRKNSHMGLAVLLFMIGIVFLFTKISIISGALFGAGASLLGAWVTELNNRHSNAVDKERRESDARRYLAPELNRTIERVLYIHKRANVNFSCASVEQDKPNDSKEDFIPYMPILYPSVPQVGDLTSDDATAIIAFYDSLHVLDKFVTDWWEREGQLTVNIFNMILTSADESLVLAEACIQKFELEKLHPPKYESWGTLSSRIECSKESARKTREHHMARFDTKNTKPSQQKA